MLVVGLLMPVALVLTVVAPGRAGPAEVIPPQQRPAARPATASPVGSPTASLPALRLVALGDSVPAGTACGCIPFVGLLDRPTQGALPARSTSNLAVPGLTSDGLLEQLADPAVSAEVGTADEVVLQIGANDFASAAVGTTACAQPLTAGCYGSGLHGLQATLGMVLSRVHALSRARVVLLDYWAVFQDGDVARQHGSAYVQRSDALTVAVNQVIARCAAEGGGAFVDLYQPFRQDGDDTGLLAADGDHPNAAGHVLIATVLQAALDGAAPSR